MLLTQRLLSERLREQAEVFENDGYLFGWVSPWWEDDSEFRVEFVTSTGQIIVGVESDAASPEAKADDMAEQLLRSGPRHWRVTDRNDWPADVAQRAIAARTRRGEGG